jgi:hypothetical protein
MPLFCERLCPGIQAKTVTSTYVGANSEGYFQLWVALLVS